MGRVKMRKPNLFIVGAPKSGTSALWNFLKQHPDIFMSETKEPWFFCKDLRRESDEFRKKKQTRFEGFATAYAIRKKKDYLNIFADWKEERIAGEASVNYLISKVAAREIYKFNPVAKIIVMVRNPVDLLYSLHSHLLWSGHETVKDFGKAMSLENSRRQGYVDKNSLVIQPSQLFYSEHVKFTEQIQRYFDVFGKKQVKVIVFDDFKKDNTRVYQGVLRFLEIDPTFIPKFKPVNVNRVGRLTRVKILLRAQILRKIFRAPKYLLPEKLFTLYWNTLHNMEMGIFTKEQPRSFMASELRKELMKKYKPEVEKLSKLLSRDLVTLWGYDAI